MNKNDVHYLIEEFYEKQVQQLLKSKSKSVLNLPKISRQIMKKKFKKSEKGLIQKMLSVLYTSEKHENLFVYNTFLKFMTAKPDSLDQNKFLFFLYIRQYYKVYTGTNFMVILNSRKDLSK